MSDSVLNGLALQHFGIEKLQEAQLESIRAVVAKENVFVFLKTGSGKTLCFSLVPLVFKDLLKKEVAVLVVSPLIALMKQQVADLESGGHAAVYLCGENKEIAGEDQVGQDVPHLRYPGASHGRRRPPCSDFPKGQDFSAGRGRGPLFGGEHRQL